MQFSRPENDWTDKDGKKTWVAVCDQGGCLRGPTKQDVQRQINEWMKHPHEWGKWLEQIKS